MIKCALHEVLRLRTYILSLDYFIFTAIVITFLSPFYTSNFRRVERNSNNK